MKLLRVTILISIALAAVSCGTIGTEESNNQASPAPPIRTTQETSTTHSETTTESPADTNSAYFKLNKDPDSNTADNWTYGGPEAFSFFDQDQMANRQDQIGQVEVFTSNGPHTISLEPEGNDRVESWLRHGIQQQPDADLMAVTTAMVRIPAEGLTAERFEIQTNTFDYDGTLVNKNSFEVDERADIDGISLFGDTILLRWDDKIRSNNIDPTNKQITAIDSATGETLWSRQVFPGLNFAYSTTALGVMREQFFDRTPDGNALFADTDGLIAVDPITGEEVWVSPIRTPSLGSPSPAGTFPIRKVTFNGNSPAAIDFQNGVDIEPDAASLGIDRENMLMAVSYINNGKINGENDALRVIDLTTNSTVFSLPAEEGLRHPSLDVLGAFDGKIWLRTGSEYSVVDARTGETDPDSDALVDMYDTSGIPLHQGDKWVVTGNNSNNPQHFFWKEDGNFTVDDIQVP